MCHLFILFICFNLNIRLITSYCNKTILCRVLKKLQIQQNKLKYIDVSWKQITEVNNRKIKMSAIQNCSGLKVLIQSVQNL